MMLKKNQQQEILKFVVNNWDTLQNIKKDSYISNLADVLKKDKSTISKTIKKAEELNLVETEKRAVPEVGGLGKFIKLSKKGLNILTNLENSLTYDLDEEIEKVIREQMNDLIDEGGYVNDQLIIMIASAVHQDPSEQNRYFRDGLFRVFKKMNLSYSP